MLLVGGIIGIAVGITASKLLAIFAEWPVMISPSAIVGVFLFSAAVGIFFGFYPAQRGR